MEFQLLPIRGGHQSTFRQMTCFAFALRNHITKFVIGGGICLNPQNRFGAILFIDLSVLSPMRPHMNDQINWGKLLHFQLVTRRPKKLSHVLGDQLFGPFFD